MSKTTTKFKAGDKIMIGNFRTYVREVYPNPNDEWYGFVKYMDENGCVDYAWESECELVED